MPDKFRILAADKLAEEGLDFRRSRPTLRGAPKRIRQANPSLDPAAGGD